MGVGGGGGGRRGALMEGIKKEGDNKNTKIKWWIIFRFATQIFNGGYKRKMNTDKRWTLHMRYVCICMSPRLPRFQVRPSKSRLFRSQSIDSERKQKNVKNTNKVWCGKLKAPEKFFFSYRKPRFCKRGVWIQVKVENSRELKQYVSQDISSNSWNSTVNKVGVLAKLFSARLCCICLIDKLL